MKRITWLLVTLALFTLTAGVHAKTTLYVQDWWGAEPTPNMQKYYDWLKSEFESQNPDVRVEYVFVP